MAHIRDLKAILLGMRNTKLNKKQVWYEATSILKFHTSNKVKNFRNFLGF